jgi:S1-C subfamily serine protease
MKIWQKWIVGGSIAATVATYSSLRDPLADIWLATQSFENNWETDNGASLKLDDTWTDNESKSRLVQQPGNSRFGRESQEGGSRAHQRDHFNTLRAFREAVGDKYKSTVQVLEKNRQIALGTIVGEDGWIVTKGSEIPERTIEVRLHDGSKAEGVVKMRRIDLDLALIKIQRNNLTPILWNVDATVPVGGWLASTDIRSQPTAIGVMSVASRNVRRERAVLGVTLGEPPAGEKGALVEAVVEGSGADRAGVRTGDLIHVIDNDTLITRDDVFKRLGNLYAGQRVDVSVQRDGKIVSLNAQMMDLNHALLDPTEMEVNGEISARSTGFQNVIQHDSVLAPHQCGGPVVDVSGNAVGINIARAGRVSSYAIPAKIAEPAIADMLASATDSRTASTVIPAAAQTTAKSFVELPASVPNGIQVETLKPEVIVPGPPRRK